ncbi:hypothetical protein [Nodosilinea sp. P-1105]|uniref:hypothetical protein n=1 Tax=Nodosilinea sp. P-1105 TaxID=2546229 RepID=UPI00146F1DC8|nr:hypothetical protein [Nodosilinea sp. P-1105]NMF81796.1 hypothetical protein [Nodosilinea sp. P-1105]
METSNSNKPCNLNRNFDLDAESADLGYSLSQRRLSLSGCQGELEKIHQLSNRIKEVLPFVSLTTERSRREILVAPIVTEVIHYTQAQLRIEYSLRISGQPYQAINYLLRTENQIFTIQTVEEDANNCGIEKLAAAMTALDQWSHTPKQSTLLGAVTTGTVWRFACFHRVSRHIDLGLESYLIPNDIEPLMRILINALYPADYE